MVWPFQSLPGFIIQQGNLDAKALVVLKIAKSENCRKTPFGIHDDFFVSSFEWCWVSAINSRVSAMQKIAGLHLGAAPDPPRGLHQTTFRDQITNGYLPPLLPQAAPLCEKET